jgi:hypothetical protein
MGMRRVFDRLCDTGFELVSCCQAVVCVKARSDQWLTRFVFPQVEP